MLFYSSGILNSIGFVKIAKGKAGEQKKVIYLSRKRKEKTVVLANTSLSLIPLLALLAVRDAH